MALGSQLRSRGRIGGGRGRDEWRGIVEGGREGAASAIAHVGHRICHGKGRGREEEEIEEEEEEEEERGSKQGRDTDRLNGGGGGVADSEQAGGRENG